MTRWTGYEASLLREAMRRTGKAFAEIVGVNPRRILRWEGRGETIELGLDIQAALDTILARADIEVQQGLAAMLTERVVRQSVRRGHDPGGVLSYLLWHRGSGASDQTKYRACRRYSSA